MSERPVNVIAGSAVAVLGGIVSIAAMAWGFDPYADNALLRVGLLLLIAALFFASAGFMYPNGKSNWASLMFITVANAAIILCDLFYGSINEWFGAILFVMAVAVAILAAPKSTGRWMQIDRV
jgi:hypothetical protein